MKKEVLSLRFDKTSEEKGLTMANSIDQALKDFKSQIESELGKLEHGGVDPAAFKAFECRLFDSLRELGRAGVAEALARADVESDVVVAGGRRAYFKYRGPQAYETFLGKVIVERNVFQANGDRSVCPLERNAGIMHHHLTPMAAEFVAYSTSHMVPSELAEFCKRWQFLRPCSTTIKKAASNIGELAEVLQETYEPAIREKEPPVPEGTRLVQFSRDGTMVHVRGEGWKQVEVGTVAFYDDDGNRLGTRYLAQMPDDGEGGFVTKFDREVEHIYENLPSDTRVVCIADGALSYWKYFEEHPRLGAAYHIADFWHATEHLQKAADALFADVDERALWVKKYKEKFELSLGGVDSLIGSIKYYRTKLSKRSTQKHEEVRKALRYFTRNRAKMEYAVCRAAGLPIGSGVMEAGCKTVVGNRLKRAGMRWSREGGQQILNLRTLVLSRRWDHFWSAHMDVVGATKIPA